MNITNITFQTDTLHTMKLFIDRLCVEGKSIIGSIYISIHSIEFMYDSILVIYNCEEGRRIELIFTHYELKELGITL